MRVEREGERVLTTTSPTAQRRYGGWRAPELFVRGQLVSVMW